MHVLITLCTAEGLDAWAAAQDTQTQEWIRSTQFKAGEGEMSLVPNAEGQLARVLYGVNDQHTTSFSKLSRQLPQSTYQLDPESQQKLSQEQLQLAAVQWALGCYTFNAYKDNPRRESTLICDAVDVGLLENQVNAFTLAQNLINTPAEDMCPADIADAVSIMAKKFKAKVKQTSGHALETHYPMLHAVGRSSTREPLFVDLSWGDKKNPLITVVGKGICFDTGGLDLKSASAMRWMKKDMGGAAHAIALAYLVMSQQLPYRLRLLIPTADNAVSGNSYRPGDVFKTHRGLTVEIHNTDAEGRLVLCEALSVAMEDKPDLLIDFATLTGAARVALGPDVGVFFSNDGGIASDVLKASEKVFDPIWRLPLYQPYNAYLKSTIADLSNASNKPLAGAITAALFLQHFVDSDTPWMHFDLMAWQEDESMGECAGGRVQAVRAVFDYLVERAGGAR